MPNNYSTGKPSDTPTFTGAPPSLQATNGTQQTGGWTDPNSTSYGVPIAMESLEALPANVRVQLSGSGISKCANSQTNQYVTFLSLSGNGYPKTLQLIPNGADCNNNPTSAVSPNVFAWSFTSRNVAVAVVSPTGLVTAEGRGECEISVTSSRAVNASFAGSAPSGTAGVSASLRVIVLQ